MSRQTLYLLPALVLCSAAGALSRFLLDRAVSAMARASSRSRPARSDLEPPGLAPPGLGSPPDVAPPDVAPPGPAPPGPAPPGLGSPQDLAPPLVAPPTSASADRATDNPSPWGIAVVNATGALGLGLLAGVADRGGVASTTFTLVGVGFLGSYTTFSTFAVDTLRLYRFGRRAAAVANVTGTLAMGLVLVAAGYALTS